MRSGVCCISQSLFKILGYLFFFFFQEIISDTDRTGKLQRELSRFFAINENFCAIFVCVYVHLGSLQPKDRYCVACLY